MRHRYPQVNRLNHVHTAGNSSGVVDGAAAMLIGSPALGKELDLKPRARFVSFATVGCEPCLMLTAPGEADAQGRRARRADASTMSICSRSTRRSPRWCCISWSETGVSHDRVNVNGGAIAMGHPIGATGKILIGTLVDELERTGAKRGVATLCVGLGMGVATLIERV